MSTQPSPSPSPTPYHPRHSQELKPNPHPYAIKTTSTGNLTRSGSVTNKNDRSFYVPSPSPSPTKSATPWNHVEERSGSGRHKYSRSLTGDDEVPKPLPAPPSHPSTVEPGEHATRSNGRPLSWSSANNQPFPQPSFVEGLPTRSRIRADPFSGNGFTFGSGPASAEDDPKAWSAAELADRLDSQADEEVKHFVLENDINGRAFLRLDEGVLNAYGITSNQYRQLLLDASRTLRQRSLRSRLNRQWPSDASAPDVDGIVRSYEVEEPEDFDDNASVSSASSTSSLRDSFGSDAGPERKKKYRPKPNRGNSRVHGIISSLEETKGIDEAYAHPHRNSTGSIGHGRSRSRSSASGSENGSDVQDQRDRDRENGINANNSMSGDPFYYPSALAAAGGRPLPSPPPGPYMDPVKQTHTGSSSGSLPMSSFDFGVGGGAAASMGMGMGGSMLEPNPVGAALPSSPSKSPSRRPLPETPMHPSLRSPPPLSPEEEEDPFGVKDHDGAHTEMTMDQLLDMLEADNKKESVAGATPFESMNPLETVKGVPSAPPSIFATIEGNTPTKRGSGHNRSASGRSVSGKLGEDLSASSTSKRSKPRSMRRVEGSYTSASSLFSAVEDIYASTSPASPPAATLPASSSSAAKDAKPGADADEEELSMEDLLAREEAKTAGKGGLAAWFSDGGDGKARVETVKRVPAASIAAPVALPAASAPATVHEEHVEEPSRSQLPTPPPSELAISHLTRASEDSGYIVVDHTDDEREERKAFEDALDSTYHKLKKQTDETRMLADEMRKRLADLEGKVTAMEDEQREKEQIRKEKEAAAAAGNEFFNKFYAHIAALFSAERPTSSTSSTNAKSTTPGASSSKDGASSAAVPHQRTPTIMCKTYTRFMLGVGLCAVVLVLRSVLFATKTGKVNVGRGWWLLRGLLGSSSTGTVRR